ncbi:MAG: hypothetical protein ABI411_07085 [Tahibacter sp.]
MSNSRSEQQRVLGRILAQEIAPDAATIVEAAGGTLPTSDSGSGGNVYTYGPTPATSDMKVNHDWPQA